MEAVQTRWHRSDRPRFPPIVLFKLYPSAVATVCVCVWIPCVSKCVHMYLKQRLMPFLFLHLVVYECQTSLFFFLTSCRYDICIQKNKPCETLGNLPSHVTTDLHISDPADTPALSPSPDRHSFMLPPNRNPKRNPTPFSILNSKISYSSENNFRGPTQCVLTFQRVAELTLKKKCACMFNILTYTRKCDANDVHLCTFTRCILHVYW